MYPDTWYVATAVGLTEPRALFGAERADVCVIGAGYTGLSAALNLAEQGLDVVLLEAERIGFGASGRNGGLVGSGQRKEALEMESLFGLEQSRRFWEFAEAAKAEIRERVARHGIDCDLQDGQVQGVHKRRYLGWAAEYAAALAERYDYPHARALSREETRALVATDDFLEGLWDSQAMTLHPLNFALGLARAARDAGVRIYENARVTHYTRSDPATVSTATGSVEASFVVLACNGYLEKLEPRVAGKIMPINNFMIATEKLGTGACRGTDRRPFRCPRHALRRELLPPQRRWATAVRRRRELPPRFPGRHRGLRAAQHAARCSRSSTTSGSNMPGAARCP